MPVWSRGTPEKFLMHVQQAIAAIKAKGLQEAYERLVRAEKECNEKVEEAELNRMTSQKSKEETTQPSPRLSRRPKRPKSKRKVQ